MAVKSENSSGQFKVAAIGENKCTLESYNRRDFYKISLLNNGSPCKLQYGSLEKIEVDRPALVLINPLVPHAWTVEQNNIQASGYFCVFDDEFIRTNSQLAGMIDRLFTGQQSPVYFPDEQAQIFLTNLFARMREAVDNRYTEKDELFRSHLQLVLHEANQLRRTENVSDNGFSRIANAFISLLRTQFPVDLPLQTIKLKTASDFADKIAVHVNHLNTAVQKATGRSTSAHISERIFTEAKSLLEYTGYTIAEIAIGLGFEYQSYFNRFFKKRAGIAPSAYRRNFEKYK